ncbi:MAG: hypothetical protein A3F70_13650 [Acidobacteria bacterium RIFCSPLOWO2_12_FULL_67_14]|nr:MAG: hypothetical protein A3H29_04545 [Acidobacteria bacterium RIFCSPLOWO2_02_FULL_67_21]OFW39587.1 MAG: hypothetical protein A3F70_13650 [Acidobacteria bacterium RIFCSPLOWO2_12_FULL_67_14]
MLEAIAAHARRDSPQECCGLLIGSDTEVIEAVATANIAQDPRRRYEVAPAEHFAQIRRCRDERSPDGTPLRVMGVYHSHPHSDPVPSPTDLEQAFEEFLYLIAGPAEPPGAMTIRGYRLRAGAFEVVELMEASIDDR